VDTRIFFRYPTAAAEPAASEPGFLDDCSEREWSTLLSHMQTRNIGAGEIVFAEGDLDRALYLLTAGLVELSGTQSPPATVQAPAQLGELAFIDGDRQPATARAVTSGEVLRLSFDAFESLAARDPPLATRILLDLGRILAARLRTTSSQ
jgi:CRP/FNR family transcriptional regulator, cyclic AMP receptor protein